MKLETLMTLIFAILCGTFILFIIMFFHFSSIDLKGFLKSKISIIKKLFIICLIAAPLSFLSISYYRFYYENQTHELYIELEKLGDEKKALMSKLAEKIDDERWINSIKSGRVLFCSPEGLLQLADNKNINYLNDYSDKLHDIEEEIYINLKKFKYAYEHCPNSEHLKDEESIYDFCVYFNVLDNK